MEHLAGVDEQLGEMYPDKKTMNLLQYKWHLANQGSTEEKSSTQLGFRYTNADRKQVIQAGINGFTFSRLRPYEDWMSLRREAERL